MSSEVEASLTIQSKRVRDSSVRAGLAYSLGMTEREYRGRIAPSPTGFLHLGHAMTFWYAQQRAREAGGKLVLRIEDLDRDRCRKEFAEAISEDLHWFGLDWDEGPDMAGLLRLTFKASDVAIIWRHGRNCVSVDSFIRANARART